jgi:ABC-type molybdate transport system substrate-binding protein
VAEEIQAGKADAGFVWTPIARLHAGSLEIVELPELKDVTARVSAAVLRTSQQPENADRFVRFVASPEGSRVFAELGFGPVKAAP